METIRGRDVHSTERRLEEGEYWPDDLIGLRVDTTEGATVGEVTAVVTAPAQDRLVVTVDGQEHEIPFVDELVPDVDMENRVVRIVPIPGLLSD